ncbi:MAG TPA: 50S ribosomal protein L24 [Solirubrobacterales bacterium]|nr:50S ribosomal protein L24 [Solirubrobacterales bacterium]
MRIRTDDQVVLIGGKDAGKKGRVVRTDPKKRRVYVEGLNMIKRAERARSEADLKNPTVGGIVEKEGPIDVSNVMLLDPKDNKPTRVGVRVDKGGKRVRYAKRTGNEIG